MANSKCIKLEKKIGKLSSDEAASTKSKRKAEKVLVPKDITSEICCTICGIPIVNFTPKYFMGHQINPSCKNCDDTSMFEDGDPFLSFPDSGMPTSLLSHWNPVQNQLVHPEPSSMPVSSLASHWIYRKIPEREVKLIPVEYVLEQFALMLEDNRKQREKMLEDLKLSF